MTRVNTKDAAEALLRQLPSVVGAFVLEDINGHPREVHLLIAPGPNPRHLARDVRDMLEEGLGVPIDQRVISIAQLAISPDQLDLDSTDGLPAPPVQPEPEAIAVPRLRFERLESETRDGTVTIRVRLLHHELTLTGEEIAPDVGPARLRAAANAALSAAGLACDQRMRFQLDGATPVRAFGREYVLVTVLASSPALGRKPVTLAAAQPLDDDPDHAAAFASLMAVNRVIGSALKG